MHAVRELIVSTQSIPLEGVASAVIREGAEKSKITLEKSLQYSRIRQCVSYSHDGCDAIICPGSVNDSKSEFCYHFTVTGPDYDRVKRECEIIKHLLQAKSLSHVYYKDGVKVEPSVPQMLRAANH